ncbi:MAG: hypothetical protein WC295_09215 [Methanoregula sp.]|jgi:hypothetical protein
MPDSDTSVEQSAVIGYDREIKDILNAIDRSGSGAPPHVAIVAEPMGGRTTIVNEIRRLYGDRVHYLTLDAVVTKKAMPDFAAMPQDIILIDNCAFLATRKIGGFDILNEFLNTQIISKKLFITTWNVYAWQYLDTVMNINAYFPTIVILPKMDMPVTKQMILSRYKPGDIRFIDEGTIERSMFFSIIHRKIRLPVLATELTIPWIKLNFTVMLSRLPRKKRIQVSIEDVIFEKINRIADGNPGVAILVWENCLVDNTITLSAIREETCALSLDVNESFILSNILSMKSVHYNDLSAIAGGEININQVVYRLFQQGLVQEKDGYFKISPMLLKCVTEYLRKTRRLW